MIEETIQKKVPNHKIDAVWVVHAETSTGNIL